MDTNQCNIVGRAFRCDDGIVRWVTAQYESDMRTATGQVVPWVDVHVRWLDEQTGVWHDGQKVALTCLGAVEEITPPKDDCVIRRYRGLPLSIDDVIARYLREIADGHECVEFLRGRGFDRWREDFRRSHKRNAESGLFSEWDSHDYTDDEMRMIYEGIIEHAGRRGYWEARS